MHSIIIRLLEYDLSDSVMLLLLPLRIRQPRTQLGRNLPAAAGRRLLQQLSLGQHGQPCLVRRHRSGQV